MFMHTWLSHAGQGRDLRSLANVGIQNEGESRPRALPMRPLPCSRYDDDDYDDGDDVCMFVCAFMSFALISGGYVVRVRVHDYLYIYMEVLEENSFAPSSSSSIFL